MSTALETIRQAPGAVLASVAHDTVAQAGIVQGERDQAPTTRDFYVTVDADKVHIRFTVVKPPFGFNFEPTFTKMCVGLSPASVDTFAKAVEAALAPPAKVDHVI
ncbi:MAG: hypothetical protein ACAI38_15110 [Myxococcota bacterium]